MYQGELLARGYRLKTRTTSQTLDMVRTCVDLAPYTDPALESFGLFYANSRRRGTVSPACALLLPPAFM